MEDRDSQAVPMHLHSPADIPADTNDRLQAIILRWFQVCPIDGLPTRDDIDPMDFPRLLSSVNLLDCLEDGDFYFRVGGTQYRDLFGRELTGEKASDVLPPPHKAPQLWGDMAGCRDTAVPLIRQGRMVWRAPAAPLRYQRVLLPLGDHGSKAVKQLLGAARFYDSQGGEW